MKKFVLFFAAAIALASCTQEIQRNEQALVAVKDGQNWRAGGAYATVASNQLTITGALQYQTVNMYLNSTAPGTYVLGSSNVRWVEFIDSTPGAERVFTTGTGRGDGEIIIQEYNETTHTVTGSFRFNAIDEDALDVEHPDSAEVVNFNYGNFYKLPVTAAP